MTQLDAHITMQNFMDYFLTSTLQHDLQDAFLHHQLMSFNHQEQPVKEVSFSAYHVGAANGLIKYDSETATSAVEKSTVHFHFQVCFLKEFYSWRWIVHEEINGKSYLRVPDEQYFADLAEMFRLLEQEKFIV